VQRFARWFALAWAVGAWLLVPRLPGYSGIRTTTAADGMRATTAARATFAEVNGPEIYLTLAVPVLAALLALLPWPQRLRRAAQVAAAAVAVAYVLLGLMTVGIVYLPLALALVVAALRPDATSRASTHRPWS